MRENSKLVAMFIATLIVGMFAAVSSAFAQDKINITVGVESTVFAAIRTSVDSGTQDFFVFGRRWEPMEQAITAEVRHKKLTVSGRFGFNGNIKDPAVTIDQDGLRYSSTFPIQAYQGQTREYSIMGSYELMRRLSVNMKWMDLSHNEKTQTFHPTSFDGSGYTESFEARNRYRGLGIGASTHHDMEKVSVHVGALFFPQIGRHEQTEQRFFGHYVNERDYNGSGVELSGRISYGLNNRLRAYFGYQAQALRTDWVWGKETRWRLHPSAGLQFRF